MKTDVLIVGAGPTGLALALSLKKAGIDCIVVERRLDIQNTSRAAVIHAHTLDVLEELGVTRPLIENGLKLTRFCMRDRSQKLLQLNFDKLPTGHPFLLMIPQDRTERILLEALLEAGGAVFWGSAAEAIEQTPEGVTARIAGTGSGIIQARYAVGADGMNSLVRQAAGIGFAGGTYEESFILADVDIQWPLGQSEVSLFLSPEGMVVVAPLPQENRYRIVAAVDVASEHPQIADIQTLINTRGPESDIEIRSMIWSSRFRVHHRVAEHYREGRLFLMGDAAHVHSPAGGQGMNTGLVDACFLGRILADVISGRCDERHLDRYEFKRKPAAEEVLRITGRLMGMATMQNIVKRRARNIVLRIMDRLPPLKHKLEMNLSGLSRKHAARI
ncbi:MAG: FAD-dependent oxidoreductase [Nitrosomonas sp.]|uniref:FAD-dependent oxidoreductase n=1 Tax=Nitrosomonas sp. TaxID=42353 RepID=UPI001D5A35BF|nr:FAD-dependent oxidoreductase [Nitrosomonas sp.]MBX9895005.1 FAD-dependent oxidoreductase [Nitrosomonas sp.]